jgi:E3 ubiquitin-protein ligase RNF14
VKKRGEENQSIVGEMSADDASIMAECSTLVDDELTVLEVSRHNLIGVQLTVKSVYDTLMTVHPSTAEDHGRMLSLDIPITLLSPMSTEISTSFAAGAASSSTMTSLELSHLPPIKVRLHLPPLYPLQAPPKIISIRAPLPSLPGAWLSKRVLSHVVDKMRSVWQEDMDAMREGSGVVWRWWEWVGTGDFLSELGLARGASMR